MCIAPSAPILPSTCPGLGLSRQGEAPRLRGRQGEAQWTRQRLQTIKRAHFGLGWWGSERALEGGECLVDLESLADVLGALVANFIFRKTVRANKEQTHTVSPC
eukprot:scaffold4613_cov129-Isochrysis_galbana.AAC.15